MKSTAENTLNTKRLLLRPIADDDLTNVFKGLSDPRVNKHYGVKFATLQETREQMQWFANLRSEGTGFWWALHLLEGDKAFIGAGGLNNLQNHHEKAEIGLWLLLDHWGKGYMQEAITAICEYGFNQLALHRIEGFVESNNTNCKNALGKLNFVHEGTMVDAEKKECKFISLDIFAILSERKK